MLKLKPSIVLTRAFMINPSITGAFDIIELKAINKEEEEEEKKRRRRRRNEHLPLSGYLRYRLRVL